MLASTRGLVCNVCRRCAHEHTGTAEAVRHSLRNGLTAYAVVSPEPNSSGLRRCRISGYRNPVGFHKPPSAWHQPRVSGPHGFAVRNPSSPRGFAGLGTRPTSVSEGGSKRRSSCAPLVAHEVHSPCNHHAHRRPRVHRISSRVRDDRDTPLLPGRDARKLPLIWVRGKAVYFCADDWTTQISLNLHNKLVFWRKRVTSGQDGARREATTRLPNLLPRPQA